MPQENPKPRPLLLVIAGPTAVGKTALCLSLAKALDTEILSVDSRQFYREMPIGTAMPTADERAAVPHHFIADRSIQDPLTAGEFEKLALERLAGLFGHKQVVIATGGSGMYLQVLLEGMDPLPATDPGVLARWEKRLFEKGIESLAEELKTQDPAYYEEVDRMNPRRLLRALSLIEQTGMPYSRLRTGRQQPRPFDILGILLERDREELYARIEQRVDDMLAEGLLEEVKSLYPQRHLAALQTVGYRELFPYLQGDCSLAEAADKIKQHTRNYAKRQMTWFRKQGHWHSFHPDQQAAIMALLARQGLS